jgi:hypothetical protein
MHRVQIDLVHFVKKEQMGIAKDGFKVSHSALCDKGLTLGCLQYILSVIDCFSKYTWVIPLRDKTARQAPWSPCCV